MSELLRILGQMYGAAWLLVAGALLVDDLLASRRNAIAASDELLDALGSALPEIAAPAGELETRLVAWRRNEIENRPMPTITFTKEQA